MAAPNYAHDLSVFNACTSATGWGEATGMLAAGGPDIDTDLAIHGSICISQDRAAVGLQSQVYTGSAMSIPTDGAVFIWTKWFAPNALQTLANGGQRVLIGNTTANYYGFYVDGSLTYAYGGWKNYAVDPREVAVRNQTQGSPNGAWVVVGNGWNAITKIAKGAPMTTDIIRFGRGSSIYTLGEVANPATFTGFSLVNDNPTTGRLGLMQDVGGSFLFKGRMQLGTTATLVYFVDSNKVVTIADTLKVGAAFNRIEVNNASSYVEWNFINFTKLGSISKCRFEMVANATVIINGCVFTDMDTFIFQSNGNVDDSTFRRCGQITVGGADFDGCLITNSTAASSMTAASLDTLTGNAFVSDGSNHAVELTSIGAGSMTWDNQLTGYVSGGSGGSPVTPTSTGNEAIYVNVGSGTLTINVASGATVPSIRSAGATVNVVSGLVTFSFNVLPSITSYEWRIYEVTAIGSLVGASALAGEETATADNQSYEYSYSAGTFIAVQIIAQPNNDYEESITFYTLSPSNQTVNINLVPDNNN